MALNMIGESKYSAERPGYEACDVYFRHLYTEILSQHDWSFARRKRILKEIATQENLDIDEEGYLEDKETSTKTTEKAWRLPVDCLRVVEMRGLKNWRIYGRDVYCEGEEPESGKVECIYTSSSLSDDGQLPELARGFAQVLILRLASALAAAVKHDNQLSMGFLNLAKDAFDRAATLDTQQDNSNDQHPLQEILKNNIPLGTSATRFMSDAGDYITLRVN